MFAVPLINEYLRGRRKQSLPLFLLFTLVALPVYIMTRDMARFVFINPTDHIVFLCSVAWGDVMLVTRVLALR